jgi:DNA helicase II / ATP-dependent DNA helicase PcrA
MNASQSSRQSSHPETVPVPVPKAGGIAARAQGLASAGPVNALLEGLNDEQQQAVLASDGPVLVLAGAGTGKTRVLTTRIAHLLATRKALPGQILAVTFTNKAAREMKERVAHLAGSVAEGMPWLGTFHAISARILRRHADLAGLKPDFTILDMDDQLRLLKQVLQMANVDEKRWTARALAGQIDGWKNRDLSPPRVPAGEAGFANGKGPALYKAYQERLKALNACDFGDLLMETLRIWREHPDILGEWQERFRYILVDEYQDTNVAQYLWLRLLAMKRRNLCCVGDDDQSIYGWRGAEVDNILRFEQDFPGAVIVRLERNYRSTRHILAAASTLIAHNEGRLGKTLRTEEATGEKVSVTGAWDGEEEARHIASQIERLHGAGESFSQMAVLVRISAQMREIEERFVQIGLPYRVIGGPRFYERAEIRDALAYLKCVHSPQQDLAFERILNTPKRGLADATLQVLHGHARKASLPLMEAAKSVVETGELRPKPRQALRLLLEDFSRWSRMAQDHDHAELAGQILEESGYIDMWKADTSADSHGRLENLKELVRSMEDFPDLAAFLEHVSLVMEVQEKDNAERVSLMTLHAAKGLEFDTVFLPGWEEGLIPSQRALDENGRAGLEEERRLAHVGLTRARHSLRLSFAANRRIHGLWNATLPSRFLDELPEESVEVLEAPVSHYQAASRFSRRDFDPSGPSSRTVETPGWRRAQAWQNARQETQASSSRRGPVEIEGQILASSLASSPHTCGERVLHLKFGPGTIASVEGNKLTINFDHAGRKTVLDSFVEKQAS